MFTRMFTMLLKNKYKEHYFNLNETLIQRLTILSEKIALNSKYNLKQIS